MASLLAALALVCSGPCGGGAPASGNMQTVEPPRFQHRLSSSVEMVLKGLRLVDPIRESSATVNLRPGFGSMGPEVRLDLRF